MAGTSEVGSIRELGQPSIDFVRLKLLFSAVCDEEGPEAQQRALQELGVDTTMLKRVMLLLDKDAATTQFAKPIAHAVEQLAGSQLAPGDRLGAWTLQHELGRGGMGCVFLAERSDGHYRQRAAVKLLLGWSDALGRLARERQILATLSHPNIARLLDGGATDGGQPYLVMEYADGVPIDAHCRAVSAGLHDRLALFGCVCDAVSYAHRHLIIHCDIKPSNVLVDKEGRLMLLDFGIARLQDQADSSSMVAALTPRYASPEQCAGLVPGVATDIYSLGRLLDELTEPLEERRRRAGEMCAIIARATATEPEQRYLSVQALTEDLARFRLHLPLEAVGAQPMYIARKLLRRRWPWLAVGGIAVLMMGLGLGLSLWQWQRAERAAQQSAQVTEYLGDMLASANPTNHGGNWPSVLALLEHSRADLPQRFESEPDTLWQLRQVLANTYRDLDRPDIALPLAEQQLAMAQRRYGREDERTLHAAILSGYVQTQLGAFDRAIDSLEPIRTNVASIFGAHSAEHEQVLRWLGYSYTCVGRFDEAEALLIRAGELTRALYSAGSEQHVMLLNLISVQRVQQGRFREARALLREAEQYWSDLPRSAIRMVLEMRYNLIVMAMRLGEYENIEADVARLLPEIERVLGKAKLAEGLHGEMAKYYIETGQYSKALRALDAAYAMTNAAAVDHPAVLLPMRARRLQVAGLAHVAAGAALLREAHALLAEVDRSLADLGWQRIHAWLALARLGLQMEDMTLVAAVIQRLKEDKNLSAASNSELSARIDQLEGEISRARGEYADSATRLRRYVRYYEGFADPVSPRAWSAQLDLTYTLVLQRDPSAFEALEKAARLRPRGAQHGMPLDYVQAYLRAWLTHGREDVPEVRAARRAVDLAFGRDPSRTEPLRASLGGAFF